ncbi:acyl-CoA dehydrogenase family protein [Streptomyces sp. DH8]|uniref:acyl-CoA dehydrogenase family protein n=1 Tax=Streptomyces sp. DH8 TaxID=2857008 RepID=UPI001E6519B6|nr:acyl-CoA dehydrogenase family protein [Streptomyces sp. DH8]
MTTSPPAAEDRIAALESLLADPAERLNPLGDEAVLAADRRGELPPGAESSLGSFGLDAEFVPVALGGRLTGIATVAGMLRAISRRDLALARGYGSASLLAAQFVWAYGTPEQQRGTARVLLAGGRLATGAYSGHGLAVVARAGAACWRLEGSLPALVNAPRAAGFVTAARHPADGGESVLLIHREDLPRGTVRACSPDEAPAPRRIPSGTLDFRGWPVPDRSFVGRPGQGLPLTVRVLQTTRTLGPWMALGCADTALRAVLRAVLGGGVHRITSRSTRQAVVAHFADLLAADCLLLVATRSLYLRPALSSIWTAAARFLAPRLLQESTGDLRAVLGVHLLREDGGYGTFHKHLRDLAELPPGSAVDTRALSTLLPHLATLARRSWTAADTGDLGELFLPDGPLPPLDLGRLDGAIGADPLTSMLADAAERADADSGPVPAALRHRLRELGLRLAELAEQCRRLPEHDPAAVANARGYAHAERYTLLVAAAACLGVWRSARRRPDAGFLADPRWLTVALGRISLRLGRPGTAPAPGHEQEAQEALFAEAVLRCRENRSLDLYETVLGPPAPGPRRG